MFSTRNEIDIGNVKTSIERDKYAEKQLIYESSNDSKSNLRLKHNYENNVFKLCVYL